jgi:hypothetical protein
MPSNIFGTFVIFVAIRSSGFELVFFSYSGPRMYGSDAVKTK